MAIKLTDRAVDHVRRFLAHRDGAVGLRLGVKRTGCSGLAYVVNYADEIQSGDEVFDADGVKVVVDRESLRFIDGTEVDYVREGLNEAFSFRNPNAAGECGCGESFNI
ncbi:MAG: iron-sulfur cluster assembly accessory protein [Gammaproteobacteria bacterium]|nr:iron-sulfur cluster assembly accessory protein [Gammaproteobacteria bacterium]